MIWGLYFCIVFTLTNNKNNFLRMGNRMSNTFNIKNVVIVGGGTSGWLTAAFLAKHLPETMANPISISLVESSDVPTIGVGEATIPSIKETLNSLGISEKEFLKHTDATFKQSIKFVDWNHDGEHSYFHHNFSQPLKFQEFNYAKYWNKHRTTIKIPYAYAGTIQGQVCDNFLGPKKAMDPEYQGPLNYAYHMDAGKFAEYLKGFSMQHGVKHYVQHIEEVTTDEMQNITSLTFKNGESINGDLFIDCSGFLGLLIEKTLKTNFKPLNDVLFVDSAVTAMVEHHDEKQLPSATSSTAKEAGWIWDIGLQSRRGTGYVYSSKYCNESTAEKTLAEYHNCDPSSLKFRHLKMRTGYREEQWKNNCVAIGLSAGFIEPLESTGIYLVEIALKTLLKLFPTDMEMSHFAEHFNKLMLSQFEGSIDFIKLHYILSDRTDSQFWIDNRDPKSIPESLKQFMKRCETKVPTEFDLPIGPQCFSILSYYAVLYGMEFYPDMSIKPDNRSMNIQQDLHNTVSKIWNNAKQELPTHRELINSLIR